MLPQGIRLPLPPNLRWKLDRWREGMRGLLHGESRPRRPQLCPACGQLVGAEQSRCGNCGTSLVFSLAAASRGLAALLPQPNPVTKLVTALNLLLFGVCLAANLSSGQGLSLMGGVNMQATYRLGARYTPALVLGHQWWRLVMPIFLHANFLHIGMNSWVLLDLGPPLEELYGSARYFFLYIATGVLGFVASTFWDLLARGGYGSSIGASGAIMGLAGLQLAISSQRGGAYFQAMRAALIRWIIIIFAMGFFLGGIDNAAHLGGLVSGFLFGRVFADREPADAAERTRANLLGLLTLVVVAASFAAVILHYSPSSS